MEEKREQTVKVKKPADTGKKPVDTGKKSVDTGKKPVDTGKKPVDTSKKTVDTGTVRRKKKRRKKKSKDTSGNTFLIVSISIAVVAAIVLTILGYRGMKQREAEEFAKKYPMQYTELIKQYAQENGIEPAYVAAVILAESSYNPNAVSGVGAQGLMQIMPETGEWIAGKFDTPYYDGCLFDPETNVKYGCWYLGYLMNRYENNKKCSSAAYHSGQGTVDQWLQDPAYSSDGKTLDVVGGENASTYVDRVLDYYEVYAGLYEKN